jgi:hypothetical protein
LFENKLLRRIFGSEKDEGTAGWRKLCSEKLHNMISSLSNIMGIKSRRLRLVGHMTCMGR